MAVGKLIVAPETTRDLRVSGLSDSRLFVGCFIQETEKHRTHSVNGPEPVWENPLTCNVSEGENYLNVELINESANNGGILATGRVPLKQVFEQGRESQWVQLKSPSSGEPLGDLKLNLTFNGTSSVSNVASSFSEMNIGESQHVSYSQTSYTSHSTTHNQSESRQGSYSSLGPANPIPDNYGAGNPPPFQPPSAAISYSGNNGSMPGTPTSGGLVSPDGAVDIQKMSESEVEEAKAKGSIPKWAKYGGGALAGVAALGLAAWGAHEVKEHYEEKEEEEEEMRRRQEEEETRRRHEEETRRRREEEETRRRREEEETRRRQEENNHEQGHYQQQQPYTIHNQQQEYHEPREYQEHHHKKEKKHKHRGSDSESSDSDSSDDERKHNKRNDSQWD